MRLTELSLYNFRNLAESRLEFSTGFNYISGLNGSGKTSLLEAIYYLGHLRSFRTSKIQRLITYDQQKFVLFAQLYDHYQQLQTIGLERSVDAVGISKLNGNAQVGAAQLACVLPVLLIHPNSYHLLDHGPKQRRQFIDWGLFHVERSFFSCWQNYHRLLKQRNAALKSRLSQDAIAPWDYELSVLVTKLHEMRIRYLEQLTPEINIILDNLLQIKNLNFDYYQGWPKDLSITQALSMNFSKDFERGYSAYGIHRADLQIKIGKHPVHEVLSRGQQKLLVIAMRLAQGMLLKKITQNSCIFLLDDITAELDLNRRNSVFSLLGQINAQVFMTLLDLTGIEIIRQDIPSTSFHVEHGIVTKL
ncbi:MAG: DNA replication/repair protein RecF [Legionellales bacterium]|nr:DNA replication/repair protein RecF [Legionellales bacterium]|tara:strand:+ start:315 stop:1397 length:1083 start_codon:yes stop_codon:yes gene_type:complete